MQIYNIINSPDGSWKAMLIGEDSLIISNTSRVTLIATMVKWAEVSGDPITLRIHTAEGELEREDVFPEVEE